MQQTPSTVDGSQLTIKGLLKYIAEPEYIAIEKLSSMDAACLTAAIKLGSQAAKDEKSASQSICKSEQITECKRYSDTPYLECRSPGSTNKVDACTSNQMNDNLLCSGVECENERKCNSVIYTII